MSAEHNDHGSTPAAWTAVIILLIGMTVSGFALWFSKPGVFWASLGVCLLGVIVGKVMQNLGYGKASPAEASSSAR